METPVAPPAAGERVRLVVAYDGSGFHGIAPQPGVLTVGGELIRLAATVLRQSSPPELVVSGRTDAGVHAWGQVVHLDLVGGSNVATRDIDRLPGAARKLIGQNIVVRAADRAPDGFHARFSAIWRRYRYVIDTRAGGGDPFTGRHVWRVGEPLDLDTLRLASDVLLGEHDFAAFCKAPDVGASTTRTVLDARWDDLGGGFLRFEIRANAFCQNMVRSLVGHLVDIGRGRRSAGDLLGVLRGRDRRAAGRVAPPDGLCLIDVGYPDLFGLPAPFTIADSSSMIPHMFLTTPVDTR
jgi:tRNA pseudouridine38-40 synthase